MTFDATCLIKKLVIWSQKRGSAGDVLEGGDDLGHECADALVVLGVRFCGSDLYVHDGDRVVVQEGGPHWALLCG